CGWWPRTDVLATVGRCGTPEPRGAVAGRQLAGATSVEQRVGGDEALVDEEPEFGERGADVHGARGQAIWDRIVVPVVGDESVARNPPADRDQRHVRRAGQWPQVRLLLLQTRGGDGVRRGVDARIGG